MLHDDGFEMVPRLIANDQLAELRRSLAVKSGACRRGLLSNPAVRSIALSPAIISLLTRHLGRRARPVKAIFFDKTQDTNWLVPWHQDVTIAVQERHDTDGYGPWTVKDGVPHVQPPVSVLEQMLTIRIHLDDCDETNGALKVMPGSHEEGRLDAEAIRIWRECSMETVCHAKAGDALLMRPLMLHSSSRSTSKRQRRVLHIDYTVAELPAPLQWSEGG